MQFTSGNNALHYSAESYADIVQFLFEHNLKMETTSAGHVEVARTLPDHGAGVNTHSNDSNDTLMEACMDGHVQVAKILLDYGANIELASLLIERGANLEEVNDEEYTPLMDGLFKIFLTFDLLFFFSASREGHDDLVN
ncbi:unnamed protein product [Rotaria sordida]|uniref:Uncharacterized protein n=1 Tax=Rotaria sordida TaxID=392033 RepID=A0A814VAR9_9BILA|nr:unnamed protein product [Rotaria sordida]CAF1447743.1 unnamed protein product [Rotaria sordida]CAF4225560.1 unnamed protein product [Rotaria sordida]